jgi:hypothetical protein
MYVNKFTPDSLPRSIDTAVHGSWDESSAYQVHESSDVIWAKMSELEKLSAFSAVGRRPLNSTTDPPPPRLIG